MSVVRFEDRTRKRSPSNGREKIISDMVALVQGGCNIDDRSVLATRLGVTPALLNYYFGSDSLLEEAQQRLREVSS